MILKCNKADKCNSMECEHKDDHEFLDGWCDDGQCRWSPDCRCEPIRMSRGELEGKIDSILCDVMFYSSRKDCPARLNEDATKDIMALVDEYMQGKANDQR